VRNWEVRFALNNGHRQPDLSGPKSATNGLMRRSKQASPIDNLLTAQEQLAKRSTNATGHLLAMFEKPTVAFEAQNFCVKSPTIQVEFEIKRSSTTTLSAVASASINFR
jgi:hypothetical protein